MLNKTIKSIKNVKLNKRFSWEKEQGGKKEKKDGELLEICVKCYSFKYDNAWHFEKPSYLEYENREEQVPVKFTRCSMCIEESLAMENFDGMEFA